MSRDVRKALMIAKGPVSSGYLPSRHIIKAEGGAVEETVPEAPHTLESQLQAFLQGKRKAVLYTHEEPALPEGASRVETQHGVFHYNPALIDERSIKAAVSGDRINEILGYGPYSTRDVLNRVAQGESPLAVVGRDAGGREVLSAAGTDKTAHEQAAAIAPQLPPGGQVHIESPANVLSERIAALRTPEQGNKDARKALMIAKAEGGDVANDPQSLGFSGPWYHGSSRIDRVVDKNEINPRRATSGPMPFFTDNPKIASNYAAKADTSLRAQDTGEVANYFTVHPKHIGLSGRSQIPVEKSWHFLPQEKRQEIANKALKIGHEKPEESSGDIILHPTDKNSSIASEDHYNWLLKNNRGNHLAALRELWHDSGSLYGNEDQLAKIYHLAGYNYPISQENAPWIEASGILPAMIKMNSPLDTLNHKELLEKVVPHLENAFKRDRSRTSLQGTDQWDKNERFTPKEWIAQLKEDVQNGKNSYAFTSIPDKITKALKGLGYDSILDTGGKMGGEGHTVAIPFEPHQVRSIFAKFDPTKQNSKKLTAATGGYIHDPARHIRKALMIAKADGGEIDKNINTAPMTKPSYAEENDLLRPIGMSKIVGEEKPLFDEGMYKAGVSGFSSNNMKSIRYLHHDNDGNPIGALQIMTAGPRSKSATIQNVYVAENHRRSKIASGLLARARQDFDVKHSKDLTDRGRAFARSVKSTGGYIHDPERNIRHALLLSQMMKSGATLPAAVDLARQLKPGRR